MTTTRARFWHTLPFIVPFSLSSCMGGGAYGPLGATCPQLTGSADLATAQFSANARANAKVRTFVMAAKDLVGVSLQMEAEASEACQRMGRDLGLTDQQMAPRQDEPGGQARAACGALGARIDEILRAGVQVQVQATPPRCQASAEARARCDAACQVQVDPGEIVARCEPAKLSGFCQGRCVGRCEGNCQGDCQGECSARDNTGRCVGRCSGTCNGGCDATCHAHCEGQWQAPRCEAQVTPPSADAECNASCGAHAEFNASCTPAQVNVMTSQNTEMVARLVATLRANLPQLLHAELALGKRITGSARVVVDVGAQLPKIIGDAGAQAMACVAAASSASVQASARISVSVQASANVTGRVGASG